jgi:hypothetical protein
MSGHGEAEINRERLSRADSKLDHPSTIPTARESLPARVQTGEKGKREFPYLVALTLGDIAKPRVVKGLLLVMLCQRFCTGEPIPASPDHVVRQGSKYAQRFESDEAAMLTSPSTDG